MQWLMLQQRNPVDYVIATGRMETVRHFAELSAKKLGWRVKERILMLLSGKVLVLTKLAREVTLTK